MQIDDDDDVDARMANNSDSSSSSSSSSSNVISSDDEDEQHAARMSACADLLKAVMETRVLNPHKVAKCSQLYLVLVNYKRDDPRRFRRNLRVSPETFDELVIRIQDHPIFHNNSNNGQVPVEIQLAVALYRFGHDGNAASVEGIAQWGGISAGSVVNYTRHVMVAFLALHDSVIHWPTQAAKEEAKRWVREASCDEWGGGFCMVDGTLVPLFEKPGYHGEVYFDRKSNYSLNVQLITLPNLRIIDYVLGHCGSAHDSTVFRASRTFKENRTLFEEGEWIWADSAYGLDTWCITPFKKPLSNLPENKIFNYHLSRVRVKSEHAMGYIKGRFCSLRGLRQQIDEPLDHERALAWIKTCIVIHTLISIIESDSEDPEFVAELVALGTSDRVDTEETDEITAEVARESRGQRRRKELRQKLFDSGVTERR